MPFTHRILQTFILFFSPNNNKWIFPLFSCFQIFDFMEACWKRYTNTVGHFATERKINGHIMRTRIQWNQYRSLMHNWMNFQPHKIHFNSIHFDSIQFNSFRFHTVQFIFIWFLSMSTSMMNTMQNNSKWLSIIFIRKHKMSRSTFCDTGPTWIVDGCPILILLFSSTNIT